MRKKRVPSSKNLRVLKLRSGEEVIGIVSGKTKDKIKLYRPMRIMDSFQTDPSTGMKRQIVFFADWLGSTSELAIGLPSDFIVADLSPDPDLIALYDIQLEKSDANDAAKTPIKGKKSPPTSPAPPPTEAKNDFPFPIANKEEMDRLAEDIEKEIRNSIKEMMEDIDNDFKNGSPTPLKMPFPPMPPGNFGNPYGFPMMGFGNPPPPKTILFTVCIPSEVVESWVECGFMDYLKESIEEFREEMLSDFEEIKPKPKPKAKPKQPKREKISKDDWKEPDDKRKADPNFGNAPDDWSSFVKDYINKKEPPKSTDKNDDGG